MHQVPAPIWNQIARSQPLDPFWREVMSADPDEMDKLIESKVDAFAEKYTTDNSVILGFRIVAPLLMENEAISAFIQETGYLNLRASLPEVVSVSEAVMLASEEYRLTPSQQRQLQEVLRQALKQLRPAQASAVH